MVVGHIKATRRECAARAVLRPLRRAAGRSRSISGASRRSSRGSKPGRAANGSSRAGASDDKGQLMTFLEACRAFRKFGGPPCRDHRADRRRGGDGLAVAARLPRRNAKTLKADVALVCDTGMWGPSTPAITTALRGIVAEEVILTRREPRPALGRLRRAAVNPIHVLCAHSRRPARRERRGGAAGLLRRGRGASGGNPRSSGASSISTPAAFLGDVGLTTPAGERDRTPLEQLWSRPTCEVNGIVGGYTGEGTKTVLPAKASAKGLVPAGRQAEPRADRPGVPSLRHRRACRRT